MKFAILGYGFIGAVHAATIKKVAGAELVAVIEKDKSKWNSVTTGNVEVDGMQPLDAPLFESIADMQKEIQADCLSICLPTFLHRQFSEKAMQAGMHVVCEKPMALSLEDCDAMIAASQKYNKQLFIAQCIRFWPEYAELKKIHDAEELGTPVSFRFERLSGMPGWGGPDSWFFQKDKSGGCLFDLHVHDVDFTHYLLGKPQAVCAQGVQLENGTNSAVVSQYHYDNNITCTIEGSWLYHSGFKMGYSAVYENGQVEYDSTQSPTLKLWRKGEEEPEVITVPESDGYIEQYKYFVDCISGNKSPKRILPESTRLSIELALAEKQAIDRTQVVSL